MKLPRNAEKVAALCLALVLLALPALAAEPIAGIASIIDADTIEIHGTRIRLIGIDAPEGGQMCKDAAGKDYRCGQRAALALADHIGWRTLDCRPEGTDRYDRTLAVCWLGSEDVNGWLVFEGWALAYQRYSTPPMSARKMRPGSPGGVSGAVSLSPHGTGARTTSRLPADGHEAAVRGAAS